MKTIKPNKLRKNDVIGIISPASSPTDPLKIEQGIKYLEGLGYRVEVGKNVGKEKGYLAGEDSERLEDLHSMFSNKNVKAIFCVRGGYGAGRLLDKINYSLIRKNPKIFVGFSDITTLQMAFLKKAGLVTFAGPMVAVNFTEEIDEYTEEIFWKTITSNKKIGKLFNPQNEKFYVLKKGRGEGKIIGGNLAAFDSLLGTDFVPAMKGATLLLEEIGEQPYKIDRMFNHLRLAKVFEHISGIILGRFIDCKETDEDKKSQTLNDVILDYFEDLNIPVIYNVQHGHTKQIMTIPFGVNCKVNASRGFIEIPGSGVL
ncbi:putative murein peptide carboxypeptidase [bacterium BMS3Abin04]|nr:putative murein peptide carboxypeptidase [bacterium BMS3Abin04]